MSWMVRSKMRFFELADPDRACLLLALMQTSGSHALRSVNGPKADIVS